ncbi:TPA: Cox family DNA-binding protein [Salmonella enterica]|nr:hypothetical protein [Salmonella enterica subsp. enterica serovar Poano]
MNENELEGFIQTGQYPIDAVPYTCFAEMIKRKESTVKAMVDNNKLPLVPWTKPGATVGSRSDNWIFLPAFNLGMRKAFFAQPKEQRDAWLLWLGL